MVRPIVTLTTDFGLLDHFVGAMKGVILSRCPQAQIVDISHEVTPFAISEGAFVIAQAWRYFPKKTVHVVIVDPGVGTARRPILVECGGQYFIGPDNGVLAMVYAREKHKAREITNQKIFLHPVSNTFHGRDIFAPAAAFLASGGRPSQLGKLIEDHLKPTFLDPMRTSKRAWTGIVLKVDRFGNLITNFAIQEFEFLRERPFEIQVGAQRITQLAKTYGVAPPGEPVAIVGSSGYVEIAINQDSAARRLGCAAGAPVDLTIY